MSPARGRLSCATTAGSSLTVHLPDGFKPVEAEAGGQEGEIDNRAKTATIRFVPPATKEVAWKVRFERRGGC